MKIVVKHAGEEDEVAKCDCGEGLDAQEMDDGAGKLLERSRFAFAMTHKRDGTPIRDLETKGAVLMILELGWCPACQKHCVVIDSTDDREYWASLPKWEKAI